VVDDRAGRRHPVANGMDQPDGQTQGPAVLRVGPSVPLGAPPRSIARRTWLALLQPKRLAPVLLVSAALVTAQASFGGDRLAVPLGVAMCLAFVLVAPVSWRVLFPFGPQRGQLAVRLCLFAAVGSGVVLVIGGVLPRMLAMQPTLITLRGSLVVCLALFLAGGWGLARDIDFDDRLRAAEVRAVELERTAERAQLLALRAHLDPHFLFNTLNAIAEWCRQDGEVAERAVLQLSSMLRGILAGVRAVSWPLATEMELIRTLFELYRMRDADLYRLELHAPTPLPNVEVPPLLLLPLAENAIKHGPAAGHRGTVSLTVAMDDVEGWLRLTLDNPGPWQGERPGGEGLRMVTRRLALAYPDEGAQASLSMGGAGSRTVAELRLPLAGPVRGAPA
jgi:two-component system, LytTR family, sensor histidine kinase AlgZ